MKSFAAFTIAAVVLAIAGAACLGVARLETNMADAQQRVSTLQYEDAKASLTEANKYADQARWVPWLGRDERKEIRARDAAVQYWQRRYDACSWSSPTAPIVSGRCNRRTRLRR
jgi:hypothetical protein